MCLAKVMVSKSTGDNLEFADVVDVADNGQTLTIATLFGEEFSFDGMVIARVDLQSGKIFVVEGQRQ